MKRVAAILALALATAACSSADARSCAPRGLTSVGERLPDCTFETLSGTPLHLPADLLGKPAVLNFWASWCVACVREMPAFQAVAGKAGAELRIVGMDAVGVQGETRAAGTAFARKLEIAYPIAFDTDGLLYYHFSKRALLPITVFVDANGTMADYHIGELAQDEITATLRTKLGVTL